MTREQRAWLAGWTQAAWMLAEIARMGVRADINMLSTAAADRQAANLGITGKARDQSWWHGFSAGLSEAKS